jgi:hypothetical protein
MAFKIKDGVRIGTVDVFNNAGGLLVAAPSVANSLTAGAGLTGGPYNGSGAVTIAHSNSVTASTASEGGVARTLAYGETFNIPSITYDANGHVTAKSSIALTLPAGITPNNGTFTLGIGTAGATNTAVTVGTGTGFSANTASNLTYDIKVGPALTALATLMTTAGAGFIKRGATADTYTIDTSTYLTSYTETDTLASVTGRGATSASSVSFTNSGISLSTVGTVGIGVVPANTNYKLVVANGGVSLSTGHYLAFGTTNFATAFADGTKTNVLTGTTSFTIRDSLDQFARVTVTNAGDVGIGVDIPTAKLDINGNTKVGGTLTVSGNLIVNGTTTTINSTTTTLDDPIITLGGDTAPASDDAKDRGVEYRWYSGGVARVGFFGYDRSSGKFTFIPDATNTSEVFSGTKGTLDANIEWADILNKPTVGAGSVTSVAMTVPTGLTVTGSPITTSGTLAVTLTAGYSIPTTASQTNWDTAFTDRNKWDGGATGLTASTGRTSLGATTVGGNLFTLTNPGAVTFLRVNADNTVSTLDAATFRTAIGAGTSSTVGTVTSVGGTGTVAGLTLSGTVTASGNLTLGGTLSTPVSTINDSTTVGQNLVKLANPGAITFLRVNADNTVSALDAANFRTAIGAQASGSYLTSYTETSTLANVTGRGATTATAISITNTTDSTTTSTGALIVSGGVAVAKNLLVAGELIETTAAGTKISYGDVVQTTVAATAATAVDTWAIATFRAVKYIVQITQGTNYQVSEIMVIHNGTTTTMTEYAVLETNGALGTFTADISAGNARLLVSMGTTTSATINIQRTLMVV